MENKAASYYKEHFPIPLKRFHPVPLKQMKINVTTVIKEKTCHVRLKLHDTIENGATGRNGKQTFQKHLPKEEN